MTLSDSNHSQHELLGCKLITEILKPSYNNSISKIESLLSKHNIDPNLTYLYGNNAIHHAAKLGKRRALQILIKEGDGDVTKTNKSGQTALMIASRGTKRRHTLCVEYLLAVNRWNINAIDHEGRTALRQAILAANVKSVELLLNHGSSMSWEDDHRMLLCRNDQFQPTAITMTLELKKNVKVFCNSLSLLPEQIRKVFNPYDKILYLLYAKIEENNEANICDGSV